MKPTNNNNPSSSTIPNSRDKRFILYILVTLLFFIFFLFYSFHGSYKCLFISLGSESSQYSEEDICECDPLCEHHDGNGKDVKSKTNNIHHRHQLQQPKRKHEERKLSKYISRELKNEIDSESDNSNFNTLLQNGEKYSDLGSSFSAMSPLMPIEKRSLYDKRETRMNSSSYHLNRRHVLRQRFRPFDFESLTVQDHEKEYEIPQASKTYCELALMETKLCTRTESAAACILRLGPRNLELTLPIRCTKSEWFQKNFLESSSTPSNSFGDETAGKIFKSQKQVNTEQFPRAEYIPPEKRPFPKNMPPPTMWDWNCVNCTIRRLPMSIPEEAITDSVEYDKLFDWNPFTPGIFPLYIAPKQGYSLGRQDEAINRELQSRSFFSWTHRRGCWQAQRHYDILAAGTIPLFPDISLCPHSDVRHCLPGFPVDLIQKAMNLEGVNWLLKPDFRPERRFGNLKNENGDLERAIKKPPVYSFDQFPAHHFIHWPLEYSSHPVYNLKRPGMIDHRKFNVTEYFFIAEELLAYTKRHLTTKAIAAYFLKEMGAENAKRVFGTSYWWLPNTVGLIHGLAALGVEVVVNNKHGMLKESHTFTESDLARLRRSYFFPGYRGAGHLYGMRADGRMISECGPEKECLEKLQDKEKPFDAYFYCVSGDMNNANMYKEYVKDNVAPGKVAFIDGQDQASTFCDAQWKDLCGKGHKLFTREVRQMVEFTPEAEPAEEKRKAPHFPSGLKLDEWV